MALTYAAPAPPSFNSNAFLGDGLARSDAVSLSDHGDAAGRDGVAVGPVTRVIDTDLCSGRDHHALVDDGAPHDGAAADAHVVQDYGVFHERAAVNCRSRGDDAAPHGGARD